MIRVFLAVIALASVTLACGQYVGTPTPTAATQTAPATSTPAPTHSPTAAPTGTAEADTETAIVRQPVVRVRDAADGTPTGEYVYAGQGVTILETSDDGEWVRIAEPPGWVFAGCLEGSERGCIAE